MPVSRLDPRLPVARASRRLFPSLPVALRFSPGNAVEVYSSGHRALGAMAEAIASAEQEVLLETYIFRSDETGRRFAELLAERASRGLRVYLLYDGFGTLHLDAALHGRLERAGARLAAFHPLDRLSRWRSLRRCDHRKLLVVDADAAFSGGVNIGAEYDAGPVGENGDPGWRDTQLRVIGPAAVGLRGVFAQGWRRATGALLPEARPRAAPRAAGEVRCAVIADGPLRQRTALRRLLVAELAAARESAYFTTPYFSPGPRLLAALEGAAQRGVRVELVLAGRSDHPLLRRAAHALLPRLLERGVRVHEYRAAIMHAKSAVFDARRAIVGTSNLDRQSLELSYEVNLVLEGGGVAERLARLFGEDRKRSVPVDRDRLAARGVVDRALDRLASSLLWVV